MLKVECLLVEAAAVQVASQAAVVAQVQVASQAAVVAQVPRQQLRHPRRAKVDSIAHSAPHNLLHPLLHPRNELLRLLRLQPQSTAHRQVALATAAHTSVAA